jgi:hypothetical protein
MKPVGKAVISAALAIMILCVVGYVIIHAKPRSTTRVPQGTITSNEFEEICLMFRLQIAPRRDIARVALVDALHRGGDRFIPTEAEMRRLLGPPSTNRVPFGYTSDIYLDYYYFCTEGKYPKTVSFMIDSATHDVVNWGG